MKMLKFFKVTLEMNSIIHEGRKYVLFYYELFIYRNYFKFLISLFEKK